MYMYMYVCMHVPTYDNFISELSLHAEQLKSWATRLSMYSYPLCICVHCMYSIIICDKTTLVKNLIFKH